MPDARRQVREEITMSAVLERTTTTPLDTDPATANGALSRLRGFYTGARGMDDTVCAVHGKLPAWLQGQLLLNGPAVWDLPDGRYQHWFDGLAMLHRVQFADGQATYRSRFVDSQSYRLAQAARKPVVGEFATRDTEPWLSRLTHFFHPRSTDNPAVVMSRIGLRWIACTESPHLIGFDPESLATLGELKHDDELNLALMSAHGMTDSRGDYWNVGVEFGPKCTYRLFRIRAGTTKRESVAAIQVKKSGYLHAFARSRSHVLVWETALRAQPLGFLFTNRSYAGNFRWDAASGSAIHAISLADGSVKRWDIPPMMCFHAVQAYEDGQDLVLDLCDYPDATIFEDLALDRLRGGARQRSVARLTRYRLRPGHADAQIERLGGGFELPQVHPAKPEEGAARWAWGAGYDVDDRSRFLDRTVRIDLTNGERREWQRPDAIQLEPLFVPRPGGSDEDDGVLLVPTLADGDASTMIGVVDPRRMECLAMIQAPQVVPFGFHAAFQPR
jgi:beta,beta-carotene 9',10'-dioxygenase